MGAGTGVFLKGLQWFVRAIEFLSSALILAVFSYFLAALKDHDLHIGTDLRAVEGISGAGCLYTLIGLLLLCCVSGIAFFSLIAIVLDICFVGAFIYVAVANRNGVGSCSGYLDTPFGKGNSGDNVDGVDGGFTALPSFHTACRLQTACFAVAIVSIVFFLISALLEFVLIRHHRKEKRYGPGPHNDYTSGSGRRAGLFGRFKRTPKNTIHNDNALPAHTTPNQLDTTRQSYGTETTAINDPHHTAAIGTTYGNGATYGGDGNYNKYESGYGYGAKDNAHDNAHAGVYGNHPAMQQSPMTTGTTTNNTYDNTYDDGVHNRAELH